MQLQSALRKAKRFESSGNLNDAFSVYKSILTDFPKNRRAHDGLLRIEKAVLQNEKTPYLSTTKKQSIPKEYRDHLWMQYAKDEYHSLLSEIEDFFKRNPEDYELLFLAGSCCRNIGEYHKGMDFLKRALAIEPENYGANLEAAKIFADTKMTDLAAKTLDYCIELDPNKLDTWLLYGKLKEKAADFDGAQLFYTRAKELAPDNHRPLNSLGELAFACADYQKADQYFNEGLALKKDATRLYQQLIHSNKLTTAAELGDYKAISHSLPIVEQLVAENPKNHELIGIPQFNLAITYLRTGQLEKGWKHFVHRFKSPSFPSIKRKFIAPRATSLEDIANKTVLIWREQGIGDELTFLTLLNDFCSQTNASVIYECDERITSLVRRSFPNIKCRPEAFDTQTLFSDIEDFDVQIPIGDLPVLMNFSPRTSPPIRPWMVLDSKKCKKWMDVFDHEKLKVGFSWGSALNDPRRKQQHLSLEFFNNLISETDATWICLDYTATKNTFDEFSESASRRIVLPDINLKDDFENLGAIMNCCDLVICPSTATRTMCGSLGVKSASFFRNGRWYYDLGVKLDAENTYQPPFMPGCTTLQLDYGLTDTEKDQKLKYFFEHELRKASSKMNNKDRTSSKLV